MVGVLLIRGWTFFKGGLRCGLDATRFYQFSVLHIWLLKPQYFCSESSFPLNTVLCLVAQSCPILCNSMDCSPPGSSVRGILQARVLEWVAMPSSRGSCQPRGWTQSPALQADSLASEPPGKPFPKIGPYYPSSHTWMVVQGCQQPVRFYCSHATVFTVSALFRGYRVSVLDAIPPCIMASLSTKPGRWLYLQPNACPSKF